MIKGLTVLNLRKFLAGLVLAGMATFAAEAAPTENITWTSENSGLNPGYTVEPLPNTRPVDPADVLPNVTAASAIVIEASTGHVIYARNPDDLRYPASTTKMMTLIMALEHGGLDEIVEISANASAAEGSTLWLDPGEHIPLNDLLYGMIMVSANDASVAIAEHLGGNVANFAAQMTSRAHELGAVNSNFTNPHGLPDNNHYSTARDLAILASYGLRLPGFEQIVTQQEAAFGWIHDDENKLLRTENRLLYMYNGCNGVKTGYTDSAGRCVVCSARRNGIQLISVVLDGLYMWNDSIIMLDYGFANVGTETLVKSDEIVKTLPIISGRRKSMPVKTAGEIIVPVFKNDDAYQINYDIPEFLTAPITNGESIGKVRVVIDGREIASTDIVTTADVEQKSFFRLILNSVREFLA